MTLQEIYEFSVAMAIKADPRGEDGVKKYLERQKRHFGKLSDKQKQDFDKESLKNPYADSRILYGNVRKEIKTVMAGIDTDTAGILLAERLNEKGKGIDLIITHHPSGHALAGLHEVMDMEIDYFTHVANVPANVSYAIVKNRQALVGRKLKTVPNHTETIDAASLLNMPLLALHTIWDNLGYRFVQDFIDTHPAETVGELLESLLTIEEYRLAAKEKTAPFLTVGNKESPTGKILVEFTGGTNVGKDMYAEFAKVGIGTIVQMHITEDERNEMQKYNMNAIDLGHIPSDSIGANIFLDELEKRGVTVISFGGLLRVKRKGI